METGILLKLTNIQDAYISINRALYEAGSVEECIKGAVYECSWVPEESTYKWYTEQDQEKDETVIYANFHGKIQMRKCRNQRTS